MIIYKIYQINKGKTIVSNESDEMKSNEMALNKLKYYGLTTRSMTNTL